MRKGRAPGAGSCAQRAIGTGVLGGMIVGHPKMAAALNAFDAAVRGDIAAWMSRCKNQGDYGQPENLSPARALLLQCLIDGLKVRAVRKPRFDKTLLNEPSMKSCSLLPSPD